MAYPPLPHKERDARAIEALMRAHPFAHFFTAEDGRHLVTRLPFAVDAEDGNVVRLRAHMNANNPQTDKLDGAEALVAFSGPDHYVSPNWRVDKGRGATWDYSAAHVWGRVSLRPERAFFEDLINDLAGAVEPRYREVSSAPDWSMADAPKDYVDRLFPMLTAFEIAVDRVEGVAKFHQDFPKEDALSVADHLERANAEDARAVAADIRARADRPSGRE